MNNEKDFMSNMRPPGDLGRKGLREWFEVSLVLQGDNRYTLKELPVINELARLRQRQIELRQKLGIKPYFPSKNEGFEPVKDFIHLQDPREFDKRFYYYRPICDIDEEAYEKVENEYRQTFHKTKYKNYESYRKTRDERIKRK